MQGKRKGICLLEVLNEGLAVTFSVFEGKVSLHFKLLMLFPDSSVFLTIICVSNYFLTKIQLLEFNFKFRERMENINALTGHFLHKC